MQKLRPDISRRKPNRLLQHAHYVNNTRVERNGDTPKAVAITRKLKSETIPHLVCNKLYLVSNLDCEPSLHSSQDNTIIVPGRECFSPRARPRSALNFTLRKEVRARSQTPRNKTNPSDIQKQQHRGRSNQNLSCKQPRAQKNRFELWNLS